MKNKSIKWLLFVPILFLLFVLILPEYQRSFFSKAFVFLSAWFYLQQEQFFI